MLFLIMRSVRGLNVKRKGGGVLYENFDFVIGYEDIKAELLRISDVLRNASCVHAAASFSCNFGGKQQLRIALPKPFPCDIIIQ